MKEIEYKKQKNRVEKLFWKWRTPLGLGWWKIELHYSDEESKSELTYAPPDIDTKYTCIFDVHSDYYYNTATITAYLPIVKNVKDEDLERYFLHEMMHILLRPMKHKDTAKEEELVATKLADAFGWVVEAVKKGKLK